VYKSMHGYCIGIKMFLVTGFSLNLLFLGFVNCLFLTYIQDPDQHSFEKLDPGPHSPKKLDPDQH
jgi:hypothetical protein